MHARLSCAGDVQLAKHAQTPSTHERSNRPCPLKRVTGQFCRGRIGHLCDAWRCATSPAVSSALLRRQVIRGTIMTKRRWLLPALISVLHHVAPARAWEDEARTPRSDNIAWKGDGLPVGDDLASIKLFAGSYLAGKGAGCSSAAASTEVSLLVGSCLSGDYYLAGNVELSQLPQRLPWCDDVGQQVRLAVFPRRGCVGHAKWHEITAIKDHLPMCLGSTSPLLRDLGDNNQGLSHWSMLIDCYDTSSKDELPSPRAHVLATPPSFTSPSGLPQEGKFRVFETLNDCREGRSVKDEWLYPASFLNLPAYVDVGTGYVKVAKPAYCADGRRAQLAMYGSVDCESHHHHHGIETHDHVADIEDVTDESLGDCIDVKAYKAVAFSCTREGGLPTSVKLPSSKEGHPTSWTSQHRLALLIFGAALVLLVVEFRRRSPPVVSSTPAAPIASKQNGLTDCAWQ